MTAWTITYTGEDGTTRVVSTHHSPDESYADVWEAALNYGHGAAASRGWINQPLVNPNIVRLLDPTGNFIRGVFRVMATSEWTATQAIDDAVKLLVATGQTESTAVRTLLHALNTRTG